MQTVTLKTFLMIVETGNFARAAARLNVTQSTVTARINTLEDEVGQKLLHRRKSGAELTSAGFKFLRYAQLMTDLWRQAQQETSLPDAVDAVLNMGCHFDLWPGLGRSILDEVRKTKPGVALSAWPGEQGDLDRWLGSGLVDAALCYAPKVQENQMVHTVSENRLILVSSVERPLMDWDPAYVYVDFGEEFRRRHAEAYPHSETPIVTFGCAVWALDYLLETEGSAYLPERLARDYIARKQLFVVPGAPEFTRRAYLIINSHAEAGLYWLPDLVASILGE